jgi:hypothetical protein
VRLARARLNCLSVRAPSLTNCQVFWRAPQTFELLQRTATGRGHREEKVTEHVTERKREGSEGQRGMRGSVLPFPSPKTCSACPKFESLQLVALGLPQKCLLDVQRRFHAHIFAMLRQPPPRRGAAQLKQLL